MNIGNYTFHDPWWLTALLALALAMWVRGRRGAPVLVVPFAAAWHRPSLITSSRWPAIFALLGLVLLIVALARPQIVEDKREVKQQGYDLMLSIDLSGSMLAEDYERDGESINRLQAIKPVIQAFIKQRINDRIGMVIFSGRAYTLAPLTFDHAWLEKQIERLKIGMIEDGTAIGDGLGVALTRLEQAKREDGGKRKGAFVVLMTDGANNRGILTPEQASEIAKSRGIPVYTIGAGKDGLVRMPVFDEAGRKLGYRRYPSDLDEGQLRAMSDATGGKFFRALDIDTAEKAFAAIDAAQKIEFQAKSYILATELFAWCAIPGAALLLLAGLFVLAPVSIHQPTPVAASRSGSISTTGGPVAIATTKSHPGMLAAVIALTLINLPLAYFGGLRQGEDAPTAIGLMLGQPAGLLITLGLLSWIPEFRRTRSRLTLFASAGFLILLFNLTRLFNAR